MRMRWFAGVAAGILLGLGTVTAIDAATTDANAQAGFTVSAAQLQINQKISQAAVKRSNRSLNYLAPIRTTQTDNADDGSKGVTPLSQITGSGKGWTSSQIADGAVTTSKLASGGVTREKVAQGLLAYWVVSDNQGNKARSQPDSITVQRTAAGVYQATFPVPINQCAFQVSIASHNEFPPVPLPLGLISAYAPSANVVQVQTYTNNGVVTGNAQDRPWHLTVNC